MTDIALTVDLSGLRCPLPVLRTKKALAQINVGQTVCIFATDPDAREDIPAFVRQAGHCLEKTEVGKDGCHFYIRKQ